MQMGLSLPEPVSSPWEIHDHGTLYIASIQPIRYRVRVVHVTVYMIYSVKAAYQPIIRGNSIKLYRTMDHLAGEF
jgi:hypothetical protein